MALGMLFLFLNNANVKFAELKKVSWRTYTAAKTLPTISWVELIDKREFAKMALDKNFKIFVVHIATLEISIAMPIHLSRNSQV